MKLPNLLYNSKTSLIALLLGLSSCIGTDFVDDTILERIVIENPLLALKVGEQYQFQATYYNSFGEEEEVDYLWSSSDESIATVTNGGLITALKKGSVLLFISANEATENIFLEIGDETIKMNNGRTASRQTTSSYPLSGTATLKRAGNKLVLDFSNNFNTTSALPGLYVYLSNSTSSTTSALEIGMITSFSGAHSHDVPGSSELNDYDYVLFFCKPLSVPVGYGQLNP